MATVRLDERRVRALKPRRSAYDIRDRELKGFGVRVLPSGAKRYFVQMYPTDRSAESAEAVSPPNPQRFGSLTLRLSLFARLPPCTSYFACKRRKSILVTLPAFSI